MPKVSIIVPIYNRECLLPRCVDSILNQTFKDFEMILVDDGSTDNSAKICDDYAELDSRVIVIHKENGGVSSARNLGIEYSTGEFIMFCDSDDYVEKQWVENLYASLSDTVIMPVCSACDENYQIIHNDEKIYYNLYNVWDIIKNKYLHVPWNKIYNAQIIKTHNLRFNENFNYAEDMIFCLNYFEKLQNGKILIFKEPTYRQCETPNSLSRKKHIDKYWEAINEVYDKIDLLLEKYNINKTCIINEYSQMYLNSLLRAINNVLSDKTTFIKKYNSLKEILSADRSTFIFKYGYFDSLISKTYYNILKNKKVSRIFLYHFLSKFKNFLKFKINWS